MSERHDIGESTTPVKAGLGFRHPQGAAADRRLQRSGSPPAADAQVEGRPGRREAEAVSKKGRGGREEGRDGRLAAEVLKGLTAFNVEFRVSTFSANHGCKPSV